MLLLFMARNALFREYRSTQVFDEQSCTTQAQIHNVKTFVRSGDIVGHACALSK